MLGMLSTDDITTVCCPLQYQSVTLVMMKFIGAGCYIATRESRFCCPLMLGNCLLVLLTHAMVKENCTEDPRQTLGEKRKMIIITAVPKNQPKITRVLFSQTSSMHLSNFLCSEFTSDFRFGLPARSIC